MLLLCETILSFVLSRKKMIYNYGLTNQIYMEASAYLAYNKIKFFQRPSEMKNNQLSK